MIRCRQPKTVRAVVQNGSAGCAQISRGRSVSRRRRHQKSGRGVVESGCAATRFGTSAELESVEAQQIPCPGGWYVRGFAEGRPPPRGGLTRGGPAPRGHPPGGTQPTGPPRWRRIYFCVVLCLPKATATVLDFWPPSALTVAMFWLPTASVWLFLWFPQVTA
jgi:hypothetical protein